MQRPWTCLERNVVFLHFPLQLLHCIHFGWQKSSLICISKQRKVQSSPKVTHLCVWFETKIGTKPKMVYFIQIWLDSCYEVIQIRFLSFLFARRRPKRVKKDLRAKLLKVKTRKSGKVRCRKYIWVSTKPGVIV